jgi:dienelactone hydrolase
LQEEAAGEAEPPVRRRPLEYRFDRAGVGKAGRERLRGSAFELSNPHGDPLRGDLLEPEAVSGPLPAVVVCHGFKGFKNWGFFPELGRRLAEAGFAAVLFNFSGSGIGPDLLNFTDLERFAADTTSRQIEDLGCILDALDAGRLGSGRVDLRRVAVLGHSRGAAVAILRAREDRRIRAVVSWAGVATFWRYSERELASWRKRGYMDFLNTRTQQLMRIHRDLLEDLEANRGSFDLLQAVARLEVPLLLVHGEEDVSVPADEARALCAAADGSRTALHIVPRTGHTFGAVHPWAGSTPALDEAIAISIGWLHAHLGAGAKERRPA